MPQTSTLPQLSPDEAKAIILGQRPPVGAFHVEGELRLVENETLTALPAGLKRVWALDLTGCTALRSLPDGLHVHRLNISGCTALKTLPPGLEVYSIEARGAGLESLPADMKVSYKLDLTDCTALRSLPDGLHVGSLIVRGCTALEMMPDDLRLYFLDAAGCTALRGWGEHGQIEVGNINLSRCVRLTALPNWMRTISQLNITGCERLTALPENLRVTSTMEIAGSGITHLPKGCQQTTLRWRGVAVDQRVVFRPETITAQEVLDEANIEVRRVKLERMGYEAFFREAEAEELDRDVDPGGVRRLLRVEFKDREQWRRDEPLVCLSVICPSTARHYIIRVPPEMRTCRQAAAWVAGFDNPDAYQPVKET